MTCTSPTAGASNTCKTAMTDPRDDLSDLMRRLGEPKPLAETGDAGPRRIPKPIYLLSVDNPDERAIVLIVRAGKDGVQRATIVLPEWQELPEGWDGPHEMEVAVPLADDYARQYGYHSIAIDIESSQMWDDTWGTLENRPDEL
jgi:hypothetical protein